jgi:radical SAM superfamily enzyme YgiQ (UPF0313 family)
MRALLINPWIYDFSAFDLWAKPLGLLKIAGCLRKLDVEVHLVDCLDRFHPQLYAFLKNKLPRTTEFGSGNYYTEIVEKPPVYADIPRRYKRYGLPKELVKNMIERIPRPEIILVTSGLTYWYPGVIESIRLLKNHFPDVPVILGGIYARLCFSHAQKNSGADIVYGGNDIYEIFEIINKLTNKNLDVSKITTDDVFLYGYQLYPRLRYICLRTSAGCPFRCNYCGWYLLEEKFSREDPQLVVKLIEYFYSQRQIRDFSFYDEALLYQAEDHLVKILEGLIKRNIRANLHTPNGLNVKFITYPLAVLMKKAGVIQPRLGVETVAGNENYIHSKTNTNDFLKAFEILKKAGYHQSEIGINIMIGLPGSTIEDVEKSIDFAGSLGGRIFLEEYSPVPGTKSYQESGLSIDADPLMHNNTAYLYFRYKNYENVQKLKDKVHKLNSRL